MLDKLRGKNFDYVLTLASLLLLLLSWELIARIGHFNTSLYPCPSQLFLTFLAMLKLHQLSADIAASFQRVALGYAIGTTLGIIIGCLTGRIHFFSVTLGRIINLFRPIPAIAFISLTIVWFGLGETPKIFLIAWAAFFPIWINTHLGVGHVDQVYIWAAKSMGAKNKDVLFEVVLPSATPFIIAGARLSISVAFTVLVAAEMTGASAGVGYRISEADADFRVDKMMVDLVVLGLLGASADAIFTKLTSLLFPWNSASKY